MDKRSTCRSTGKNRVRVPGLITGILRNPVILCENPVVILRRLNSILEDSGRFAVFLGHTVRLSFKRPYRFGLLIDQMEQIGVASVPIIALSSLAIGMIFALQMVSLLQPFQAEIMTGMAVAKANARELAPVITALMLIGKNGSSMAAEIGTMRVTEQIDAMETMSVNPIHYLVVPRIFATIIMFPMLTLLANVIGVLGAYLISVVAMGVEEATYLTRMFEGLRPVDVTSGLIKAAVMGYMVAVICTYFGFNADNGAKGVGDCSTQAVVTASVAILVADYLLATIMMAVMY